MAVQIKYDSVGWDGVNCLMEKIEAGGFSHSPGVANSHTSVHQKAKGSIHGSQGTLSGKWTDSLTPFPFLETVS